MKTVGLLAILVSLAAGCGSSTQTSATPASQGSGNSNSAAAMPDRGRAIQHLSTHIEYPATRAEILAACADTKEFTNAEKQWFTGRLPEGTYSCKDDVAKALGLN